MKEWYTVKEAANETPYTIKGWDWKIRNNEVIHIKQNRRRYIHRSEVEKIKKEFEDINKNYISISCAAEMMNKTKHAIHTIIYKKQLKNVKVFISKTYILKTELEQFMKDKMLDKAKGEYISSSEVKDLLNLTSYEFKKLIIDNEFEYKRGTKDKIFVSKESFENFKQKFDNAFTCEETCKLLNLDVAEVKRLVFCKDIKSYHTDCSRLDKESIDNYIIRNQQNYDINQVSSIFGVSKGCINNLIRCGKLKSRRDRRNRYIFTKAEIDRYMGTYDYLSTVTFNSEDYYKAYNIGVRMLNKTQKKETLKHFKQFIYNEMIKSNRSNKVSITNLVRQHIKVACKTLDILDNKVNKELHQFCDKEIKENILNDSVFNKKDKAKIIKFLNYLLLNENCNYKEAYTFNYTNTKLINDGNDIYTKGELTAYFKYLSNIDEHLKNAILYRKYSQIWLFVLLHLAVPWRYSDILDIPAPYPEVINVNCFKDLEEKELTLEEAQRIINQVKEKKIVAKKNGQRLHFVVSITIVKVVATVLILNELHRRKATQNSHKLIHQNQFDNRELKKFLPLELPKFKSRKMNKTIMSYNFEVAVNQEGRALIAYDLVGYSRSHKMKLTKNDVTSVYLVLSNTDASVDKMSYHLFERGFFGWQISLLLNLAYDTEEWNMDSKTKMIKKFSYAYKPMAIDGMSEYMLKNDKDVEALVNELLRMNRKQIMNKLLEIANYKSPSMNDYSQCLKGIENCPYKTRTSCLGCKYLIPLNYLLGAVNEELIRTMNILLESKDISELMKVKYTHIINKLMYIIMDFRRAYKIFDNEYFKSFIDLEKIKVKYTSLERENKLMNLGGS